jgi:hypothetical protein
MPPKHHCFKSFVIFLLCFSSEGAPEVNFAATQSVARWPFLLSLPWFVACWLGLGCLAPAYLLPGML